MQRGDTIIEVLFAVTVFSLVAVGGLSIMNQGITTSQRSLEITLVRQEIDSQAEALRFLNDSYVASYQPNSSYSSNTPAGQWTLMLASIIASGTHQATAFGASNVCPVPPNGSFIINTRTAQFVPPPADKLHQAQTYAKVDYETSDDNAAVMSARGIWIEAIRSGTSPDSNQTNAGYIDFHIMACWSSPGQSVPVTIGTIVRLYEPRG
jgi:type II secretory pathway pseudopilin PulG